MKNPPMMSISGLSYAYGEKPVFRNISLSIKQGEVISLLGPNGSGKTTLLKLMLGFFPPTAGDVRISGCPISRIPAKRLARRIAYVPQTHRPAFPYLVKDVVMMGLLPHKSFFHRFNKTDRNRAEAALERVSIAHLRDRPYSAISGGERQLCLIARALTQGAELFMMDEPVTGLDYGNQIRLLEVIRSLAADGFTFVQTTHFPDHALWVEGRVVMLKNGRIMADGTAGIVVTDQSLTRLYNRTIHVTRTVEGVSVCVPGDTLFGPKKQNDKLEDFHENSFTGYVCKGCA